MALPSSGPISLDDVNIELGSPSGTTRSMNDSSLRSLFGVSSGAIAMSDGRGKSNSYAFSINSPATDLNLRSAALSAGWGGSSAVVATISPGVEISSSSTGTPALTVDGSFPGGVSLINNGSIYGRGGNGGNGQSLYTYMPSKVTLYSYTPGTDGGGGGPALYASVPVSVTNAGTIAGGGGGGGAGAVRQYDNSKVSAYSGGGAGGGGIGVSTGGTGGSTSGGGYVSNTGRGIYHGGPASPGGSGTLYAAGSGSPSGYHNYFSTPTGYWGQTGGNGGSYGSSGSASNYAGGGAGPAVNGSSLITWVSTGNRYGPINA